MPCSTDSLKHLGNVVHPHLQKGAISTATGNVLWAAEVEVHGITPILNVLGSLEDRVGVISAKLFKTKHRRTRLSVIEGAWLRKHIHTHAHTRTHARTRTHTHAHTHTHTM